MRSKSRTDCCADCNEEEVHWASVIKAQHDGQVSGICLLCNRCSGVHRSIGVHICEVRSLSLDTWPDELAERLDAQEQPNLNAELEYHVPMGMFKPNRNSLVDVFRDYIIPKYVKREFSRENNPDKPAQAPMLDPDGGHELELMAQKSQGQQLYHGVLNIFLKRASKLPTADIISESDPYCIFRNGHF